MACCIYIYIPSCNLPTAGSLKAVVFSQRLKNEDKVPRVMSWFAEGNADCFFERWIFIEVKIYFFNTPRKTNIDTRKNNCLKMCLLLERLIFR